MTKSKAAFVQLIILLFPAPAFACVFPGYLKTDTCNIQFNHEQDITSLLFENQAKCGLTDEEVTWLSRNINIYSKVIKETDAQYKARLLEIEAQKIKKTPENKVAWDTIDKKNNCSTIFWDRKGGQFSFFRGDECAWFEETQSCACPNC